VHDPVDLLNSPYSFVAKAQIQVPVIATDPILSNQILRTRLGFIFEVSLVEQRLYLPHATCPSCFTEVTRVFLTQAFKDQ
jgi:hypothetical protein